MSSRKLWRRYRGAAGISLVLGALIGWVVVLIIGGDTRMLGYKFLLGGSFGVVTALVACFGGFVFLFYRAHKVTLGRAQRENTGAAGAGFAVLLAWLLFAAWMSLSDGFAGWFMFFLPIAIISGIVTWVVASVGLHLVERRKSLWSV